MRLVATKATSASGVIGRFGLAGTWRVFSPVAEGNLGKSPLKVLFFYVVIIIK